MRLDVLCDISDPGSPDLPNEDARGHTARSAWVLDGATGLGDSPLLPEASDAAWLARAYSAWLRSEADDTGRDLRRLFADLVARVSGEFEARKRRTPSGRFDLPSAGMAFVRLGVACLEYARLGDCRAILAPPGGTPVLFTGSSPLQQLDAAVVAKMEALRRREPSAGHARLRRAVSGDLRANRSRFNAEGGYWVLGTDAGTADGVARNMEVGSVTLDGGGPVRGLLMSDGFYRLVDTFRAYPDDAALIKAAGREGGLEAMLAELRALEDADPECVAHPRLKPRDDATALLFEATTA
jgi:hypothetical protein